MLTIDKFFVCVWFEYNFLFSSFRLHTRWGTPLSGFCWCTQRCHFYFLILMCLHTRWGNPPSHFAIRVQRCFWWWGRQRTTSSQHTLTLSVLKIVTFAPLHRHCIMGQLFVIFATAMHQISTSWGRRGFTMIETFCHYSWLAMSNREGSGWWFRIMMLRLPWSCRCTNSSHRICCLLYTSPSPRA